MVALPALLSAGTNGLSTVLQRVAAAGAPPATAMRASLLGYLLRRRIWLAGLAALTLSFLFQAGALDDGTLAVVQPLLLAKLPLTVLLALVAFRGRVRVRPVDWLALVAMSGGLALVLGAAAPSPGVERPSTAGWVLGLGAAAFVVAGLVGLARRHPGAPRAALLGAAAGLLLGVVAALIKGMTGALDDGVARAAPYAAAVTLAGLLALLLQQLSLQAGSLAASQPASTIVGTLVSVLLGVALFGEHVRVAGAWPVELAGIALVVTAVFATAHSPLVSASAAAPERPEPRPVELRLTAGQEPQPAS